MKSLKHLLIIATAMTASNAVFAEGNPLATMGKEAKNAIQTTKAESMQMGKDLLSTGKQKMAEMKTAVAEKAAMPAPTMPSANIEQQAKEKMQQAVEKSAEKVKAVAAEKVQSVKDDAQKTLSKKININKADAKTLQALSGIGEAKAKAIVAYREQVGKFKNLTDLAKVSGIGESTLEKIKPFISF